MQIAVSTVKEVRVATGAGILECRNALQEAGGDVGRAIQLLKGKGLAKAEKKQSRATSQGLIEAYVHTGGRVGALVEVNCETDFVARTPQFQQLAHDLTLQVAATSPQFIAEAEMPPDSQLNPQEVCLLQQPFIKNPQKTVKDIIMETIALVGENVRVRRFARFELGNQEP